jgi:hypothetical protein
MRSRRSSFARGSPDANAPSTIAVRTENWRFTVCASTEATLWSGGSCGDARPATQAQPIAVCGWVSTVTAQNLVPLTRPRPDRPSLSRYFRMISPLRSKS